MQWNERAVSAWVRVWVYIVQNTIDVCKAQSLNKKIQIINITLWWYVYRVCTDVHEEDWKKENEKEM